MLWGESQEENDRLIDKVNNIEKAELLKLIVKENSETW